MAGQTFKAKFSIYVYILHGRHLEEIFPVVRIFYVHEDHEAIHSFSYIEIRTTIQCAILHINNFVNIQNQTVILKIKQIKSRNTAFRVDIIYLLIKCLVVCMHLYIPNYLEILLNALNFTEISQGKVFTGNTKINHLHLQLL